MCSNTDIDHTSANFEATGPSSTYNLPDALSKNYTGHGSDEIVEFAGILNDFVQLLACCRPDWTDQFESRQ